MGLEVGHQAGRGLGAHGVEVDRDPQRAEHASQLVVLSGQLRLRVADEAYDLGPGDSISFTADKPHVYENPAGSEARYHDVIVYER